MASDRTDGHLVIGAGSPGLAAAAAHGWRTHAASLRGHGESARPARFALASLRHYQHDVLQAITLRPHHRC